MFHYQNNSTNRIRHYFIYSLLTVCAFANSAAMGQPSTEVSICLENQAFPPIIAGKERILDRDPGIAIELTQAAATAANIKVTFIRLPWARCLDMVKKGHYDALLPSIKTQDRALVYQYPTHGQAYFMQAPYHIFYPKHSPYGDYFEALSTVEDKASLIQPEMQYGISAPFQYVVNERLKRLGLLAKHIYEVDQGLKMVAINKLDGYVFLKQIGLHKLEQAGTESQVSVSQHPFMLEKLYIPFNKAFYQAHKSTIDGFWYALGQARVERFGD